MEYLGCARCIFSDEMCRPLSVNFMVLFLKKYSSLLKMHVKDLKKKMNERWSDRVRFSKLVIDTKQILI